MPDIPKEKIEKNDKTQKQEKLLKDLDTVLKLPEKTKIVEKITDREDFQQIERKSLKKLVAMIKERVID